MVRSQRHRAFQNVVDGISEGVLPFQEFDGGEVVEGRDASRDADFGENEAIVVNDGIAGDQEEVDDFIEGAHAAEKSESVTVVPTPRVEACPPIAAKVSLHRTKTWGRRKPRSRSPFIDVYPLLIEPGPIPAPTTDECTDWSLSPVSARRTAGVRRPGTCATGNS